MYVVSNWGHKLLVRKWTTSYLLLPLRTAPWRDRFSASKMPTADSGGKWRARTLRYTNPRKGEMHIIKILFKQQFIFWTFTTLINSCTLNLTFFLNKESPHWGLFQTCNHRIRNKKARMRMSRTAHLTRMWGVESSNAFWYIWAEPSERKKKKLILKIA